MRITTLVSWLLFTCCWLLVSGVLPGTGGTAQHASAQDDTAATQLHPRVSDFFRTLGELNGMDRAFDDLLAEGPLEESERIKEMVEEVRQLEDRFGPPRGIERVGTKAIGTDVYVLTYLAKTTELPIIWKFAFYRRPAMNGEGADWVVVSVRFDTNMQSLEDL